MKVIILAGGLGSRISEETVSKPKPMVLVGDSPILWHIFTIFAKQGFEDFLIALGYKGDYIRTWLEENSIKIDKNRFQMFLNIPGSQKSSTPLKILIELIDTGLETLTGGRIKKCMDRYPSQRMMATYGDGLANVSLGDLLASHISSGLLATVTAVRPVARFGFLEIEEGKVLYFGEKDQADAGWINGGFFVLEPEVRSYIKHDFETFESGALPSLVANRQLNAFQHYGFFKPMDTLRERNELEELAKLRPTPWLNGI